VTNVKLNAGGGENPGPVDPTPTPGPADGSGTEADPYSVAKVIALNATDKTTPAEGCKSVYVKGYIVGFMPSNKTVLSNTQFTAEGAVNTNLVLAPTADCKDYNLCIPVQLPAAVRATLALDANPTNLGKCVLLQGDILNYCSASGLKNTKFIKFVD
jgi:hypothetical protein